MTPDMSCPVCGGDVAIAPSMFDAHQERWDCTRCPAWGTVALLHTLPIDGLPERVARLAAAWGVPMES